MLYRCPPPNRRQFRARWASNRNPPEILRRSLRFAATDLVWSRRVGLRVAAEHPENIAPAPEFQAQITGIGMGNGQIVVAKDARPGAPRRREFVTPRRQQRNIQSDGTASSTISTTRSKISSLGRSGSFSKKGRSPSALGWFRPSNSASTVVSTTVKPWAARAWKMSWIPREWPVNQLPRGVPQPEKWRAILGL